MAHLRYVRDQHSWQEVAVYSPSLSDKNSPTFHEKRRQLAEISAIAIPVESAKAAVTGADVVLLCTSSGEPVIDYGWLSETVTVTSISTNVARAHEIDPATLAKYQVFCDYRKTAPLSAGELVIAKEKYGWKENEIVADLPELISGKHLGCLQVSGKLFFRSIGLGIEDIAVASLLISDHSE